MLTRNPTNMVARSIKIGRRHGTGFTGTTSPAKYFVILLAWLNCWNGTTFAKNAQPTFSSTGFINWKDAMRLFHKHNESCAHKESLVKWAAFCSKTNVTAEQTDLNDENTSQSCLLRILSASQFIGWQELAVRVHVQNSGNSDQLFRLLARDNSVFRNGFRKD